MAELRNKIGGGGRISNADQTRPIFIYCALRSTVRLTPRLELKEEPQEEPQEPQAKRQCVRIVVS